MGVDSRRAFLMSEEVKRCQINRNAHAPTPAVPTSRMEGSARNMRSWRISGTKNTSVILPQNAGMDELGNASVIDT